MWLSVNFLKMAAVTWDNSWRAAEWVHCVLCGRRATVMKCTSFSELMGGSSCRRLALSKACLLYFALTRMFLSNAPSSFATGIVLQRFAITGRRRLTRGGQSLLMWRQWFCFFRMFGIVFLPAQSGRCCHGDSGSSWLRSCRPSERRRMENRHWTANPSLLISTSHRKAQELQKQTPDTHQTQSTPHLSRRQTHADYFPTKPHLGVFCLLLHLSLFLCSNSSHQHIHLPSHPADTYSGSSETRLCCVGRESQLIKQLPALQKPRNWVLILL